MATELSEDTAPTLQTGRDETMQHFKARLDELQRVSYLEERWHERHPILARLLSFPFVGNRLRHRRRSFVKRNL